MSIVNVNMTSLFSVIEKLRSPEGCPWDLEQDLLSMRPYLLEETFELLEALDLALPKQEEANHNQLLCEELGDLLFVVLLLAQIAEDQGRFSKQDCLHPFRTDR